MSGLNRVLLVFLIFLLTVSTGFPKMIQVDSINFESKGKHNKLILDVTASTDHRVFFLDKPSRLVVDVKNALAAKKFSQPSADHPLFAKIRSGINKGTDLRIVVDLKDDVSSKNFKLLADNSDKVHLVVDLVEKKPKADTTKDGNQSDIVEDTHLSTTKENESDIIKTANSSSKRHSKKRFVVAIDAGHGGDDPGAKGPSGTYEKTVTLAIAKKLKALIDGQAGMVGKMVRNSDYYVGLRDRMKIARKEHADLFVSIHADAVDNPSVRGASVYTLSRNGASNEAARWLANHENAKEKVAGVDLEDKEEVLASVLLDLSQTATQQASFNLAQSVLKNFRNVGTLHYNDVQKAGFVVLKSPDIPSILVETAYISNPSDEMNLLSGRYQAKMAQAIFRGIVKYYEQLSPTEINRMAKL